MKSLLIVLFSSLTLFISAQEAKRTEAWDAYKSGDLILARQLINETCLQSDTKDHPKTWYFKGLIYREIDKTNTPTDDVRPASIALNSILKSRSLDDKQLFVNENLNELLSLSTVFLNKGSAYYNQANKSDDKAIYNDALNEFEDFFTVMKNLGPDSAQIINLLVQNKMSYTDIIVFAGFSAAKSENTVKAKVYYSRLLNYPKEELVSDNVGAPYAFIAYCKLLSEEKNYTEAIKVIDKAIAIWPDNKNLAITELKLYQDAGMSEDLLQRYEKAVVNDPKNVNLISALASKYDILSSGYFNKGDYANADKYRLEAVETYKIAINLKPADMSLLYDLYYNSGVLYYNPAVDQYNKSLDYKGIEARKPFKDKYDPMFKEAIALFEQAYSIKSNEKQLIDMMTRVYLILENIDKATELKEKYKSLE
jgi:tetratricopeptide (TPR) repeat protein